MGRAQATEGGGAFFENGLSFQLHTRGHMQHIGFVDASAWMGPGSEMLPSLVKAQAQPKQIKIGQP
jgi:hypothetical protein